MQLVEQVKAFQRGGGKQQWWDFCDGQLGGVRDPARHDVNTLRQFLQMSGAGGGGQHFGAGGGGQHFGGCRGKGGGGGGKGGGVADDPEKAALVDRVKSFQKQSPEQKEVWYAFCGPMKDPARHDVSALEEFCNMNG